MDKYVVLHSCHPFVFLDGVSWPQVSPGCLDDPSLETTALNLAPTKDM